MFGHFVVHDIIKREKKTPTTRSIEARLFAAGKAEAVRLSNLPPCCSSMASTFFFFPMNGSTGVAEG